MPNPKVFPVCTLKTLAEATTGKLIRGNSAVHGTDFGLAFERQGGPSLTVLWFTQTGPSLAQIDSFQAPRILEFSGSCSWHVDHTSAVADPGMHGTGVAPAHIGYGRDRKVVAVKTDSAYEPLMLLDLDELSITAHLHHIAPLQFSRWSIVLSDPTDPTGPHEIYKFDAAQVAAAQM